MEAGDFLAAVLRWFHIGSAIMWVGLLYFFNFAYMQFAEKLDPEGRKKAVLELIPRTAYWFRWGAIYTWVTGFLLLGYVYYHGGLMFEAGSGGWTVGAIVMVVMTFAVYRLYMVLAGSKLVENPLLFAAIGFAGIAVMEYLMINWGGFSYRAYSIHIGAMFGTIMAGNVWEKIWPAQKRVFAAIKGGTPPDPADLAVIATRSRHNTYLSLPVIWTMINIHTTIASDSWLYLLGAVAIGWGVMNLVYKKAGKLSGVSS